mmetsp:Transcript_17273/g.31285  ORF Transcript_17273/g.31285 Transcript_17273/m.31285 type:complete len:236 (+) Transcript_17273:2098-2805(+)
MRCVDSMVDTRDDATIRRDSVPSTKDNVVTSRDAHMAMTRMKRIIANNEALRMIAKDDISRASACTGCAVGRFSVVYKQIAAIDSLIAINDKFAALFDLGLDANHFKAGIELSKAVLCGSKSSFKGCKPVFGVEVGLAVFEVQDFVQSNSNTSLEGSLLIFVVLHCGSKVIVGFFEGCNRVSKILEGYFRALDFYHCGSKSVLKVCNWVTHGGSIFLATLKTSKEFRLGGQDGKG